MKKEITLTESELSAIILAAAVSYNPTDETKDALAKLGQLTQKFIVNWDSEAFGPCTFTIRAHTPKTHKCVYNKVLYDTQDYVAGELLTDKELEKARNKRHNKNIQTEKVEVCAKQCYYFFGARFAPEADID